MKPGSVFPDPRRAWTDPNEVPLDTIVVAVFAVLIIATRGPLIFAPTATVDVFRRWIATPGRVRIRGAVAALMAAPMIVAGRAGHAQHADIAGAIEGLGWLTAAVSIWLILAPELY